MINELVEVGTELLSISDQFQRAGKARRERISQYFTSIEDCLKESVECLKQGTLPHRQWGELETYGWELPDTIGKEIGKEKAKSLAKILMRTASSNPSNQDIPAIEQAAGKFKALSHTVKIKRSTKGTTARRTILNYTAAAAAGFTASLVFDKITDGAEAKPEPISIFHSTESSQDSVEWKMETFLADSAKDTILWKAPSRICELVSKMTNGKFKIELARTGNTEQILEKVSAGQEIECGYSGIYYSSEKYQSLFFGCAIPFGLTPQEQDAWLDYRKNPDQDRYSFIQSIYKEKLGLNIIPFPAGATGGQMGGWFREKISSLDDFNDLEKVMRIPGLGAKVFEKLGMTTHESIGDITIAEAVTRLNAGLFYGVEWTGPHDDIQLGLDKAANFYYYPGWWEPGTTFDAQVNIDAWNKLPENYQNIFEAACKTTHTEILTEYNQKNSKALQTLRDSDIEILPFDISILEEAKVQTNRILDLQSAQDPVFKEVYDEWKSFRESIRDWSSLTKLSESISQR